MHILAIANMDSCDTDASQEPSVNPLESGFIDEGSACETGKTMWYDSSKGESYGCGNRYAHEETPYMTRVPSRHR
jgi:hypothetical protein